MNKNDIPQDISAITNYSRELYYVKNNDGQYETGLSTGWETKAAALDNAWDSINERIESARIAVLNEEMSPIYYFMEKNLMDFTVLTGYVGYWKFRIKRHLRPAVFRTLDDKVLQKYADAFGIPLNELKSFKA